MGPLMKTQARYTSFFLCFLALISPLSGANFETRMAASVKSPWTSAQRTASQTRWQSVTLLSNTVTSKVSYRTNSFVELGAGLNVTNSAGQFISANPSFTITPTGAEAQGTAHKVVVPGDIGTGAGVKVTTPGGEELVFQPLAIDYFDPVDGQGVLLDVVTNAVGWLVASNEIVFSNCFTHIKASIRLKNTRAGLESDLILHESPPEPSEFGLSSSARLEMLTEQLAGPVPVPRTSLLYEERDPVKAATMLEPNLTDTELTYGQMKMGAGRAFVTPNTTNLPPSARSSRVAKSFLNFENRKIIIEAVEHRRVRPALLLLPPATNGSPQASLSPLMKAERLAKNTRRLPALSAPGEVREAMLRNRKAQPVQQARIAAPNDSTVQLASAATPAPAFVLDYYLVGIYGETDFTFRSDETYWVSCPIALSGTTTVEGGTVIKYSEASGLLFFQEYDLVFDTTEHLPAVFTSFDDNSVGEDIGGSGSPTQIGACGFYFISGGSRAFNNVRFTYLSNPIAMEGGGSANDLTLRNVQVRDANYVVDSGTTDLAIYNGLFVDCGLLFNGASTFVGEHLTLHNASAVGAYADTATLRNSLLVAVTDPDGDIASYTALASTNLSSGTNIFASVEGGAHYLAAGSVHRNAGTTNINAQLRAALTNLTTHAPEVLSGTLATNLTLRPRAIRDTDALDLGYHYPAVDYLAKTVSVQSATLTLLDGVVVAGGFASNALWTPALRLAPGKLVSLGTPERPNYLLRASQVQENVPERGHTLLQDGAHQDTFYPEITLRFTELSSLADETYLFSVVNPDTRRFEASHSRFINGQSAALTLYGGTEQLVGLTNNLFRSVGFVLTGNSEAYFYAYNNLFKDGAFSVAGAKSDWRIFDNVFDHITLNEGVDESPAGDTIYDNHPGVVSHNAFVGVDHQLSSLNDSLFQTNLTYVSGPLGRYYYATGTTLTNAGSRSAAAAGLYHFTTTTNQVKETNSTVDIGLHYASVATNAVPLDTDADGLADYLEDSNGNGTADDVDLASFTLWDTDNDGLSDGQEYQRGTDPKVADSPRAVYEGVISSQSPSNWFKLNDARLTNSINGQTVTTLTNVGSAWDVDAFGVGNGAFSFTATNHVLGAGDVINGGTGADKGSMTLLFRSIDGFSSNTPRYMFHQRGTTTTNDFGAFFEPTNSTAANPGSLKVHVGGQTNAVLLSSDLVFGSWYYLALTWDETRPDTNGAELTWYVGRVGGTLTNGSINLTDSAVVGSNTTVYLGNRDIQTRGFRSPGFGALDEIALWNRELTGNEISAQFDTLKVLFQGPAKAFDLSRWELTLPVDKTNNLDNTHQPLDIKTGWLNNGFKYGEPTNGTQKYFYLSNGNTLVFEAPWNGADQDSASPGTKLGSPRSELRETLPTGGEFNWKPYDPATGVATNTHTLQATCRLENVPSKLIFGQIHADTPNPAGGAVPAVTLFHEGAGTSSKKIQLTVYYSPDRSVTNPAVQTIDIVSGVNLGDRIDYELKLEATTNNSVTLYATVKTNGILVTPQIVYMTSNSPYSGWAATNVTLYFKAGCYYPTAATNSGTARVSFSSLGVTHQP